MPTLVNPPPPTAPPHASANAAAAAPGSGQDLPARGPFVRVMTAVIIALVLAAMALIFWRSFVLHEPSTAVILIGDQTLDGAQAYVHGEDRDLHATLDANNGFSTPILLDPGHYSMEVSHRNHVILKTEFDLDRFRGMQYTLPCAVPIIGAGGSGPTEVLVEGETDGKALVKLDPITLDAADRFRENVYLSGGEYRASASQKGRVVAVRTFHVRRGVPVEINVIPSAADQGG